MRSGLRLCSLTRCGYILHYSHGKEVNLEPHSIMEMRETSHRKMMSSFSYITMQSVFLANKQKAHACLGMKERQIWANSEKSWFPSSEHWGKNAAEEVYPLRLHPRWKILCKDQGDVCVWTKFFPQTSTAAKIHEEDGILGDHEIGCFILHSLYFHIFLQRVCGPMTKWHQQTNHSALMCTR